MRPATKARLQNSEAFLADAISKHERLTGIVRTLIENILSEEGVEFLSIAGRTKTLSSALEKIDRKFYDDPSRQLTDLTGIRIITFLDNQVTKISKIILDTFEIDDANSMDRSQILGNDKVGYRSVHFVCILGNKREGIREYKDLCALKFEIQIRTVLQHAWAELTHDRAYKFSGVLPQTIQRKLNLYAGMLEIVDSAFDEIAKSIDAYEDQLRKETRQQLLEETINSISLNEFVRKIAAENNIRIVKTRGDDSAIDELSTFGVTTLNELQKIITDDFINACKEDERANTGLGLLQRAMMFSDIDKYFGDFNFDKAGDTCEDRSVTGERFQWPARSTIRSSRMMT
jgi:putative GTP pyrophosphokinase